MRTQTEVIPTRTVLWAAGVMASSFARRVAEATGAATDRTGRVARRAGPDRARPPGDLRGRRRGRGALEAGPADAGVAQGAMQGGTYAARTIRRRVLQRPTEPFRYRDKGDVAVIGRSSGVTEHPVDGAVRAPERASRRGCSGWASTSST